MHITGLEIEGFKSYGTRTEIKDMDKNFTAITGLNGTGKSNVLDAICFVLGIDSPRLLRTSSLKDLIFSGAKKEARVTVHLSNPQHDPSSLHPQSISLTRTVSADGRTRYAVNGHPASNRSVARMLHALGLAGGKSGDASRGALPYFVVMQGRIGGILSLKGGQFLSLLEECAGTHTYREEKKRALAALEKKEEKLRTTQDILHRTVFPFLQRLKEERKTYYAAKEAEHRAERLRILLSNIRTVLDCRMYRMEAAARVQEENEEAGLKQKIEDLQGQLQMQAQAPVLDVDVLCIQEQIDTLQNELDMCGTQDLIEEKERYARAESRARECLDLTTGQILAHDLLVPPASHDPAEVLAAAEASIKGMEMRDGDKKAEKEAGNTPECQIAKEKAKEKQAADLEGAYEKLQGVVAKMDIIEQKHSLLPADARDLVALAEQAPAESRLSLKSEIHKLRAEIKYPILSGVHGTLAELLTVKDPELLLPVCVVLGGRRDYLVVDDEVVAKKVIETVEGRGRIDIIPLNRIRGGHSSQGRGRSSEMEKVLAGIRAENQSENADLPIPLFSVLEYPAEIERAVEYVFGSYVLSPSRSVSVRLRDKHGLTSVTLSGEVFDRMGTITGGSIDHSKIKLDVPRLHMLSCLQQQYEQKKKVESQCRPERLQAARTLIALEQTRSDLQQKIQILSALAGDAGASNKNRRWSERVQQKKENTEKHKESLLPLSVLAGDMKEALESLERSRRHLERVGAETQNREERGQSMKKEIRMLLRKKTEGLKRNETNRARRSIQYKEEQRLAQELSELKKQLGSLRAQVREPQGKPCRQKCTGKCEEEALKTTKNPEVCTILTSDNGHVESSHPQKPLQEIYTSLASEYSALCRTPHRQVNPGNVEVLEKNEEMENTLRYKIEKLQQNKKAIECSIDYLNKQEEKTLVGIYNTVNEKIGSYMRYFIPDSDARLQAVNESPLNGVELLVKIGTWKKGIAELSGGQKSICALSLIFALLKSRASPVYILDEIDAALDASHTEAVGKMIQREFAGSQFLVVSLKDGMYHNAAALFQTYIRDGVSGLRRVQ